MSPGCYDGKWGGASVDLGLKEFKEQELVNGQSRKSFLD